MLETKAVAFLVLASMYTILFLPYVLVAKKHPPAIAVTGALRSVWASRFAGLGVLGFLGALGFVPTWGRLFGFMGFFGFLGIAYVIEAFVRFTNRTV